MATNIEAYLRWLVYRPRPHKDAGHRVTREIRMAKLSASEMAVRVADQALQIHGGYGFIKDYAVKKSAPRRQELLCTIGEEAAVQRLVPVRRQ